MTQVSILEMKMTIRFARGLKFHLMFSLTQWTAILKMTIITPHLPSHSPQKTMISICYKRLVMKKYATQF
jgi:hypothetical protein